MAQTISSLKGYGPLKSAETPSSEKNECLLDVTFNALHLLTDDIETDSLGYGSALTNSNDITNLQTESWGDMAGDSLMALLKSVVLLDVVEIIATDNNCS